MFLKACETKSVFGPESSKKKSNSDTKGTSLNTASSRPCLKRRKGGGLKL